MTGMRDRGLKVGKSAPKTTPFRPQSAPKTTPKRPHFDPVRLGFECSREGTKTRIQPLRKTGEGLLFTSQRTPLYRREGTRGDCTVRAGGFQEKNEVIVWVWRMRGWALRTGGGWSIWCDERGEEAV